MSLLRTIDLGMHHGGPVLFERVNLTVDAGARIGFIGRNGSGKSTLLKILAGQLAAVAGQVQRPRALRVGYQAQELDLPPETTVYDAVRSAAADAEAVEAEMREVEVALATDTDADSKDRALRRYAQLQERQAELGLYDVERQVETTLTQLGLHEGVWQQPVGTFSGGEQNVIGLARVIVADPDVLLLDEPSNHLDMDGVEWFIRFLRKTKAAVLMVSHNRHMLDATADRDMGARTAASSPAGPATTATSSARRPRPSRSRNGSGKSAATLDRAHRVPGAPTHGHGQRLRRSRPGQARQGDAQARRAHGQDRAPRRPIRARRFGVAMLQHAGKRHGRIALYTSAGFTLNVDGESRRCFEDRADLEIEFGERVCTRGPQRHRQDDTVPPDPESRRLGAWDNQHTGRLRSTSARRRCASVSTASCATTPRSRRAGMRLAARTGPCA